MGRTIVRREFARTRANSPAFAANSPVFADCSPTFYSREHWRTIGEHSANSREHWRSSREFARIRAEFAANWRTVRQKSVYIKSFLTGFKYSANDRSPRTIVRREQSSLMKLFAANDILANEFTTREQSFAENSIKFGERSFAANNRSLVANNRSLVANNRSPRTFVRHEG